MAGVLQRRVLSSTGTVFYQVHSKVGTITVICMWSGAEVSGAQRRSGRAKHGREKCMMGCRCSTGTGGIDRGGGTFALIKYLVFGGRGVKLRSLRAEVVN